MLTEQILFNYSSVQLGIELEHTDLTKNYEFSYCHEKILSLNIQLSSVKICPIAKKMQGPIHFKELSQVWIRTAIGNTYSTFITVPSVLQASDYVSSSLAAWHMVAVNSIHRDKYFNYPHFAVEEHKVWSWWWFCR